MPVILREIKAFTAQIPSGSPTSNAWNMAGWALAGLFAPVINSGFLAFEVAPSGSPSAPNAPATDGPYSPLYDNLGYLVSAATPGGTGGVALDSNFLASIAGFVGPVHITGAPQTALRTFWVHLKG